MSKGKGQQVMEHHSFPLEFQLPDGKNMLQTAQRCYRLKIQSLYHCSIDFVPATIYILIEIPFWSCNLDMSISYTPIFLFQRVVRKFTYSRFQQLMWGWGVKCWKIKCLDWCSCTDIKLAKWWQQTCYHLNKKVNVKWITDKLIPT